LTGPERRRRWSDEDQRRILSAAFAPGATVVGVARQYEVATSQIYKWRRAVRARETGFSEVVVVPDELVAAAAPAPPAPAPPAMVELEIAGKVRMRIPLTTPPTLAVAIVKALGVS